MGIIIICLIIFGAGLLLYMLNEAFLNNVVEHELYFSDFPETFGEFRIFFISDIHRRRISDTVIQAVKGKADIVIIGGDLVEKGVPVSQVKENILKLNQIAPAYFVWGNNDVEMEHDELIALMEHFNVKILENTAATFTSGKGEKLSLLGVADLNQKLDRLDLALLDCGENSFKILASHYPKITEKVLPNQEIRLVMSGHTHGGQIHILGYSPYKRGRVEKMENTTLLVSNGYGTTAIPLRLGAPAESHLIILRKG